MNVTPTSVEIQTPDGVCDANLAKPAEGGPYPGVIFLMDAFGVRPVIDEWIERIAGEGYVVLAPNLFYRSSKMPVIEDVAAAMADRQKLFQSLMPMMQLLTPENIAKDSEAYIEFVHAQAETAEGPVALTGYCLGTRVGLRAAAAHPDAVSLVAGFHGSGLVTDKPDSIHVSIGNLKAQVYLAYADHDDNANPEQQKQMDEAFAAAGIKHESEVYAEAPHGYTMADTPAYRQDAAERHFKKLIELLKSAS